MEKSANKRWKESGTTLTFKEWIDRENKKKDGDDSFFIKSKKDNFANQVGGSSISDSVTDSVNVSYYDDTNNVPEEHTNKIFGLNQTIVIVSAVLLVGSLGYLAYKKINKK